MGGCNVRKAITKKETRQNACVIGLVIFNDLKNKVNSLKQNNSLQSGILSDSMGSAYRKD